MSFYDVIDKRLTIRKAKQVLDEYCRFRKIIHNAYQDISLKSSTAHQIGSFSSYINSDAELIRKINKKDRDYDSLNGYVEDIQSCIALLELEQIELLNFRYVDCLTNKDIRVRFEENGKPISERQLNRKMNDCYIDFAITYGIHVLAEGGME